MQVVTELAHTSSPVIIAPVLYVTFNRNLAVLIPGAEVIRHIKVAIRSRYVNLTLLYRWEPYIDGLNPKAKIIIGMLLLIKGDS